MASNFQLLPTPHEEEFMFSVRVPQDYIGPELVFPDGSTLISAQSASLVGVRPTSFKQCGWTVGREMLSKFPAYGDYVYLKSDKQRDPDYITLFFGRPRTPEQRRVPFNIYYDTRQYTWPSVLEDLFVAKAVGFPQVVNNGPDTQTSDRLIPRYRYRPGISYNSTILVEQFLSDIAYSAGELTHVQPVPTDVNGNYIGLSVNYERCLHSTCVFPKVQPETPVFGVGVYPAPINRNSSSQIFPATNFLDWAPFIIEDRQQNVNGLWLRERITIYPPSPPDEVIQ